VDRPRFQDLQLEAFVHATESRDLVEAAMLQVAPGARVEGRTTGGHFGQPLQILRARLRDGPAVDAVVGRLAASEGAAIARSAGRRVDEQGRVFVRLDKQAAARGRLELSLDPAHDVIKVSFRLRAPPRRPEALVAAVEGWFAPGTPGAAHREEE
jgi:RNA binding exosome subunit